MKRISVFLLLFVALALPAIAGDTKTDTVALPTIQCGMCRKTIETKLSKVEGLDSVSVDVDGKVATVVYDPTITSLSKIELAISAAGYDANEVKADKRAQKKLHPCCQPGAHD